MFISKKSIFGVKILRYFTKINHLLLMVYKQKSIFLKEISFKRKYIIFQQMIIISKRKNNFKLKIKDFKRESRVFNKK